MSQSLVWMLENLMLSACLEQQQIRQGLNTSQLCHFCKVLGLSFHS
jgi:hypothetical protein